MTLAQEDLSTMPGVPLAVPGICRFSDSHKFKLRSETGRGRDHRNRKSPSLFFICG